MDFDLNETQKLFKSSARELFATARSNKRLFDGSPPSVQR